MPYSGKIVLFVEGSVERRSRGDAPFESIWKQHIVSGLGLHDFCRIVPISKKDLLVGDKELKNKISGVGSIPIDVRIARELARDPFDVAVIAWDIRPFDPRFLGCRWHETLRLYQTLAESSSLPELWKECSGSRFNELRQRANPTNRRFGVPQLKTGAILAVCMEHTFESLLLVDEQTIKSLFRIKDSGRVGWPRWDVNRPDPEQLLQEAIEAAGRTAPLPQPLKLIRGGMDTKKNEWGEYLLRYLVNNEHSLNSLKRHKIGKRLSELLHKGR